MYQHAKRDVHNFSETTRKVKIIEPGVFSVPQALFCAFIRYLISYKSDSMAVPVRRAIPAYYRSFKSVRNVYPCDPQNNHEGILSRIKGSPVSHTKSRSHFISPSGMRFVFSYKYRPKRFLGLATSQEEAKTHHRLTSDPFCAQYNDIPGVDALPMYDPQLWRRLQKASDDFEELKEHFRCIKELMSNWLETSYRLILSFIWYIIVCALSASDRPPSHYMKTSTPWSFVVKVVTLLRGLPGWTAALLVASRLNMSFIFSFVYLTQGHDAMAWILSTLDAILKLAHEYTEDFTKLPKRANAKEVASTAPSNIISLWYSTMIRLLEYMYHLWNMPLIITPRRGCNTHTKGFGSQNSR
jgi:hypothetical protein